MYDNFMTPDTLSTFAGLVAAVSIIVQFTKPLIKKNFVDGAVRIYTFIISIILTFIFARTGEGIQGVLLTTINSILITMTSMGMYETIADPKAQKSK
ncbi:hypothetical protein [Anaerosalibacter massiliensis]|uniref:Uncharacterized protein n=1 Tax=Anaerosalibacter massiliensis TaxID=1347392 RepID=A0A9X2MKZ4_9FIRM|nr:hypothetical protein [Anaerosalibacter massiliensis]MCR2045529.1 hypothetical protein [Anaerosalibacter massiliensis]